MKYDSDQCQFTDLRACDLDEVIGWLERIQKNEFLPEPEWARACIEDGGFIQNESDRRFYTSTKMYQQVSLLVIRYLRDTPRSHLIEDPVLREHIQSEAKRIAQEAWAEAEAYERDRKTSCP